MSNYTVTTNFTAKDSLPSGDAGKVIKGADHQTEYNNIATAVNSKADTASPSFTGTMTLAPTVAGDASVTGTLTLSKNLAGSFLPAGVIMQYGGAAAPTGWLLCDGSAIDRTTYSVLFTAISTTYGTGNGTTTFNLPDLRGRLPIGSGTGVTTEACTTQSGGGLVVASNNTKWITGMPVVFSNITTFTGISAGPTYYVIRSSSTLIKFATTLANAQNGTVDVTIVGASGTATVTYTATARTLGELGGEEAHAMSSTELLSHTHALSNGASFWTNGGVSGANSGGSPLASATLNNTGGNAAMNIMQPFVVVNYIIKT